MVPVMNLWASEILQSTQSESSNIENSQEINFSFFYLILYIFFFGSLSSFSAVFFNFLCQFDVYERL